MENGNGWKLIEVTEREWVQDSSGVYTVIHWTKEGKIRADLMNTIHFPLVSFVGTSSGAVYKGLADYLKALEITLSAEHAMYIGKELARCEILKAEFIQD